VRRALKPHSAAPDALLHATQLPIAHPHHLIGGEHGDERRRRWPCILITASARAAASVVGRDRPMWRGSSRPCIGPGRHVLSRKTRTVAGAAEPASCKAG